MSKGKEIIIPAKKGEGGICFGPYALGESVCGVPKKGYFYAPYIPIYALELTEHAFGLLQFYAGLLGLLKKRKEEG